MNISDKMKGDKEDENDEVVHFEPTLWEPNKVYLLYDHYY